MPFSLTLLLSVLATFQSIFPAHASTNNLASSPTTATLRKRDSWGGAVSLGPTKSQIISAVTTLVPGRAPSVQSGLLFLWPGMSNGTGDLIQTTLESWPDNSWCGAEEGQWCVRGSLFGGFGQLDGTAGIVNPTDMVEIAYTRGEAQEDGWEWMWYQTVTNACTRVELSSFAHLSGTMLGYGTGTECNEGCTTTTDPQTYYDTVITLESGDLTFGDTIGVSQGATYTGLESDAEGKVWKIARMDILAMGGGLGA